MFCWMVGFGLGGGEFCGVSAKRGGLDGSVESERAKDEDDEVLTFGGGPCERVWGINLQNEHEHN